MEDVFAILQKNHYKLMGKTLSVPAFVSHEGVMTRFGHYVVEHVSPCPHTGSGISWAGQQ